MKHRLEETRVWKKLANVMTTGLVLARGAGGAWHPQFFRPYCPAPVDFGRSVNPIQTRGADYAHHITNSLTPPAPKS